MAGSPDVLSGTFAGRYTIERELGSGATATVYLARDTQRGISVAVKLLRPELAQSVGAERFLREIRLNEKLHHPHIVPVLDSGEHDGRLYFVLPHMEDGSLRQLLQREKQLPIETAISIARTIAQALDYAHQQNLIHRDVKPENILFTSGQACLADFGIARAVERALDESTTDTGMVRGTPAYMSPEQASGSRHYDGRSDQYSLACVLYEMLAGVPAFIGPTPEAVIAQRFQHAPRELRVYRPTVSAAVEEVVGKALALAPADRYGTSAEFARALESALRHSEELKRPSAPAVGLGPRKRIALAGAGVLTVAVVAWTAFAGLPRLSNDSPGDSTAYVVLPPEGDAAASRSASYDLLLRSLGNWKGITVADRFAVREILGNDTAVSDRAASRIAQRLGAGRYIRLRVTNAGSGYQLYAASFDARTNSRRSVSTATMGFGISADTTFGRVARTLLLPDVDSTITGSMHIDAVRHFGGAMAAIDEFNLAAADSLLVIALDRDKDYSRASMWLAQVRNWQFEPARRWLVHAEAATAGGNLTSREARMASALTAIGRGEFGRACRLYTELKNENSRDFAAWYGLGQCHHHDNVVVPDRRSPSGWRYRSSYHQAVIAYTRALELAPALHRSFEPGAYSRLRFVLYTMRNNVRSGNAQSAAGEAPRRFMSYATWSGDSILFVPYPSEDFQNVVVNARARTTALLRQRQVFAQIARTWSTALPRSAGAKEAVAIALEMLGDPSAVDTVQAARTLATDPLHRLRLAQQEVLLRVEFARHDSLGLRRAARLADSVLKANGQMKSQREAEILAPLASLLGRCDLAGRAAVRKINPNRAADLGVPPFVVAIADSLTVLRALGCAVSSSAHVARIRAGLRNANQGRPASQLAAFEYMLLGRGLSLGFPPDTESIVSLAHSSGDPVLLATAAMLRGDSASVKRALERRRGWRMQSDSPISPDGALEEARLWITLGDTATAIQLIDPLLARTGWLEFLEEPVSVATLLQTAALRASLGDKTVQARTWRAFLSELWSDSDPELKKFVAGSKTH